MHPNLVEESLGLVFSPALGCAFDAQCCQGGWVVREYACSLSDMWANMASYWSTPLGSTSW